MFWKVFLLSPRLRAVLKQIDLGDHMSSTHYWKKVEGLVLPQSWLQSEVVAGVSTSARHSSSSSYRHTHYLLSNVTQRHE